MPSAGLRRQRQRLTRKRLREDHMFEDFSIWSAVTVLRLVLLAIAVVAIAIWATRQPDQHSMLIGKLTKPKNGSADDDCVARRFRELS